MLWEIKIMANNQWQKALCLWSQHSEGSGRSLRPAGLHSDTLPNFSTIKKKKIYFPFCFVIIGCVVKQQMPSLLPQSPFSLDCFPWPSSDQTLSLPSHKNRNITASPGNPNPCSPLFLWGPAAQALSVRRRPPHPVSHFFICRRKDDAVGEPKRTQFHTKF
jgi:hypothetical protein